MRWPPVALTEAEYAWDRHQSKATSRTNRSGYFVIYHLLLSGSDLDLVEAGLGDRERRGQRQQLTGRSTPLAQLPSEPGQSGVDPIDQSAESLMVRHSQAP